MFVIKASGEKEEYNPEKIRITCLRAGASEALASRILRKLERKIYPGITTKKILETTLEMLNTEKPHIAAKYDLKRAIMRLGPAGFVFETFVAKLLEEYGYKTQQGVIVSGECVKHEIDVVATRGTERLMVECKYHNSPGIYTGIKDALYVYARFLDLKEGFVSGKCKRFTSAQLVSNTKFSSDAAIYGKRKKSLNLIGWKYPMKNSLSDMLEKKKVYPITSLSTLTENMKDRLTSVKIVTVKDIIMADLRVLQETTKIPYRKLKNMRDEAVRITKT